MNEFKYEMLNLDNVEKYSNFFKKEIKIADSKENIIDDDGSADWVIELNTVEYMTRILKWNFKEKSFKRNNGEKITPIFENNFTQLVIEKKSWKVVAIIDAREYNEDSKELNYLSIWWVLVNKDFTRKWIAWNLYSNLESFWKRNLKISSIRSSAIKKNIASCNLHIKKWYKIIDDKDKIRNYYSLDVK